MSVILTAGSSDLRSSSVLLGSSDGVGGWRERRFLGNGAWNLRRARSRTYEARCLGVNIHPGATYPHTHTRTCVCNLFHLVSLSSSHDQIKAQAVLTHTPVCLHLHLHYTTFSPKLTLKSYLQMIYSAVNFCQLLTNRSVPAFQISPQTRCDRNANLALKR